MSYLVKEFSLLLHKAGDTCDIHESKALAIILFHSLPRTGTPPPAPLLVTVPVSRNSLPTILIELFVFLAFSTYVPWQKQETHTLIGIATV